MYQKTQELGALKTASGLSNKAWDKGIKGLTKIGAAKVSKTEEVLFVSIGEQGFLRIYENLKSTYDYESYYSSAIREYP